jgi:hypothetical protein
LLLSPAVLAGGPDLAKYPLRVHIFQNSQQVHYMHRSHYVDGKGSANLYENSEPRGFAYKFWCVYRLRISPGYETYPARWKKPNKTLEILLPVTGKTGKYYACDLDTNMKDTVYYFHGGKLVEGPPAVWKQWMETYQYDPEKGKNDPVVAAPAPAGAGTAGTGTAGGGASPPQQKAPQ